jgi:CubicO group peptidase (beta-lactamase class C family)
MNDIPSRTDITLSNWRTNPASRYSFQNVAEFVPAAMISTGAGEEQPARGESTLNGLQLVDCDGRPLRVETHLRRSHTDHLVIMREGEVIAEWIEASAHPARPHLVFSISKSVTGLMAGIAVGDGLLDPEIPVARYVPSMTGSGYGNARVRDLLDMTVDIDFDEEYLDDGGAFDRYRRAMLWNPERPETSPETMEGFLATLGSHTGDHGKRFYYASPNTDLLGLVVERATGVRFHDYLAQKLWQPMGAKGAAYVTVDRVGTARAAGGICMTTRDLARMGQLVLDGGRNSEGDQVVPASWIDDLRGNGNRQAWVDGNFSDMFENGRYRSCWYDVGDERQSFAAVGIHGQWLWVDPTNRIIIAKTSSRPAPSDDDETALEIHILSQIAKAF